MINQKTIGTHDGKFHCDQVLACAMLKYFTQEFKGSNIKRSRDPKVWETCDILVDVGGKYQAPKLLDHHQIQFDGTYPNYKIRLSSAGLVYLHFPEIIQNIIQEIIEKDQKAFPFQLSAGKEVMEEIREKIYKTFIIFVDAGDNGIDKVNDKQFSSVPTTLWHRVAKMNPMWWEQKPDETEEFLQAIEIAKQELYNEVRHAFLGGIQTKSFVREAFLKRKKYHDSGKIVVLERFVPWQNCLSVIEKEEKCPGQIIFVIFPERNGSKHRIQAVPKKEGSFELRKGLKTQWRGIKDMEKLKAISKIDDIDFVHANGFIGGAASLYSTIRMGVESL